MKTSSKIVMLAAALVAVAVSHMTAPTAVAQDAPAAAAVGTFLGSKSCKKCHIKEHRSWEATHKATALTILAPGERADAKRAAELDPAADYRGDATCLECHVVGFGQPGGFTAENITADPKQLGGVGCESCHGAGGGYLVDGMHDRSFKGDQKAARLPAMVAAGFVAVPNEESCRHCHDPEKSKTVKPFNFEERVNDPKGLHERPAR